MILKNLPKFISILVNGKYNLLKKKKKKIVRIAIETTLKIWPKKSSRKKNTASASSKNQL